MSLLVLFSGGSNAPSANTYTFQWQDSTDGSTGWANISSATLSSYTVAAPESTKYIRCNVTATNSGGSATTASNVLFGTPINTVSPAVTGTATVGSVLSTTNGTWSGSPTSFTYQWQRDAFGNGVYSNIGSATASSYTLLDVDDACHIRCVVTGATVTASSQANSNAAGTIVEIAPTNSAVPVVTGTASVGSVLSSTTGTFTHMGGHLPTFTYHWQTSANGSTGWTNIGGATSSTYTVLIGDNQQYLRCSVTATNTGGALASNSVSTSQVIGVPANTVPPVVTGVTAVRAILTSTTGTWTGSPTFAYQWQSSFSSNSGYADVSGATSSTYDVADALNDQFIVCIVTATNAQGSVSQNSSPVGPITGGISFRPHGPDTILFAPHVQDVLTLTPLT